MVPKEFLLIAGDEESDRLAAALAASLRQELTSVEAGYNDDVQPLHASLEPRFYGAGGRRMAEAGVELIPQGGSFQAAKPNVIRRLLVFRRAFEQLYRLALDREPHAIVCVGFFGFNLRFASAIKHYVRHRQRTFYNWDPIVVQFGVPPRWASRASRVEQAARNFDCVLTMDPSKKIEGANDAPNLRVEFVGQGKNPEAPEVAGRTAQVIIRLLEESEAHFPLRAFLAEG